MKGRRFFLAFGILVFGLVVSSLIYSQIFQKKADETVNKIIMIVTLPDSTSFKATVAEDGEIVITGDQQYYRFVPTITDVKMKTAHMNAVEVLSSNASHDELIDSIEFEIIDIINVPKKFKKRATCQNGKCCITCGSWTACACAVEFGECKQKCCCDPCCPPVPIE